MFCRRRSRISWLPCRSHDSGQHDQRSAVVAPQISPRKAERDSQATHHAARMASTGFSQWSRRAG